MLLFLTLKSILICAVCASDCIQKMSQELIGLNVCVGFGSTNSVLKNV